MSGIQHLIKQIQIQQETFSGFYKKYKDHKKIREREGEVEREREREGESKREFDPLKFDLQLGW